MRFAHFSILNTTEEPHPAAPRPTSPQGPQGGNVGNANTNDDDDVMFAEQTTSIGRLFASWALARQPSHRFRAKCSDTDFLPIES